MPSEREVRTRVAPSPTGDPHIGTAFQLLFNHVFARSRGGKCLLRIEDTDQTRSTGQSERAIIESLRWLGLEWDEGPDVGGPCGPYRQSERTEIYREHCDRLLESGAAYRCFCTPERLAELRREQEASGSSIQGYDKRCATLSSEEVEANLRAGKPYVVRLNVPVEGECVVRDMLREDVVVPWRQVDDQVLMKSDGFPTYHLANVVDDHLMGITHVLRGEEWISSAPKHLRLYEAFGWEPPELCHLPLLRNPDKSKLSKRKNPTSILYYRRAGFLPEALVNYLGMMAYTPPDGAEMFSVAEMAASFDVARISLGGPIFDVAKLTWLNGRYIREKHTPDELHERLRQWLLNDETWRDILPLAQPRIEKLSQLVPLISFFFEDELEYDPALLIPRKSKLEGGEIARLMKIVLWRLEALTDWRAEALQAEIVKVSEVEALKIREVVGPLFVAVSGSPSSTPLFESMELLGPEMTRRRVRRALEALEGLGHGVSKKREKALEKEYREKYQ